MSKKMNMVPLNQLNLTDRFLFDEVMEDSAAHQAALSIIFGRSIPILEKNETEKEFRTLPQIRSIRMDVYSVDEEQVVYNTEMQQKRRSDLAKRSRYYQSMVDSSLLETGIPDYNLLNDSYIIMIMPFDLFGYGKYRYTFKAVCQEVPELCLGDGAARIFLNTRGKNDGEVSKELREFLHYLEDSTDEAAKESGSEWIKQIHRRVCKVKSSEEVGVKYMQAWEEKYYEKEEARREGLKEGLKEGLQEGLKEGLKEGLAMGERNKIKDLVEKKVKRGISAEEIADILEEDLTVIQELIQEITK